jgi:geranylgeranyl diphosphate synthase, type II
LNKGSSLKSLPLSGEKFIGKSGKFLSIYENERKKIDLILKESLKGKKPFSLYEPALYISQSGGKRLRPLLVLFSAKAAGGKFGEVYNAAAAVEFLHNFTLVHDDIMDNADMRRGIPTLHKKFDMNTAILAGDILLAEAYKFLLKDIKEESEVLNYFTQALIDVCEGQSIDKIFETQKEVSIEEYIGMIQKKTAALAEMCCVIGASLGGGSKKEIKALGNFGKNLGIAFQIQDDLLDIIGAEQEFGKITGSDLIEGKKTYLFVKAFVKAEGKDKEDLLKLTENRGIDRTEIPKYKSIYENLGIIDEGENDVGRYTEKAINSLESVKGKKSREILIWLADSLIKRMR